jgi:uncharacterized protein YndB with AHSA1/START domain
MKEITLKVVINKSSEEVFDFYIDPKNTPLWIDSIIKEETSEWPVQLGTRYRNQNKEGVWSTYEVTGFKKGELFELAMKDSSYHVRYTHVKLDDNHTELTYFEWVDTGELAEPFSMDILAKLKSVIEQ